MKRVLLSRTTLVIFLLAFVVLFIFYPALDYFFTRDDFGFLKKGNAGWLDLPQVVALVEGWFYRPLSQQFYFFVNFQLFGTNPAGYHASNLFFHFLNSLLVFLIVQLIIKNRLAALVGATFFAANRIHLQSVYWVSGFSEVGGTFFYLLTFYLFLLFLKKKERKWQVFSTLSLIVALLSKENTVTFPVAAASYLFFFGSFTWDKQGIRSLLTKIWPYVVVVSVYLILYKSFVTLPTQVYQMIFEPGSIIRLAWHYTQAAFISDNDLSDPESFLNIILIARVVIFTSALILLLVFTFLSQKLVWQKFKVYLFGGSWFYLSLVFFVLIPDHVFSYYLSIPLFGLSLLAAKLFQDVSLVKLPKKLFLGFGVLLMALNILIGKINHESSSYLGWVNNLQKYASLAYRSIEMTDFEKGETIYIVPFAPNPEVVSSAREILFFGEIFKAYNPGKNLSVKFVESEEDMAELPLKYSILQFNQDASLTRLTVEENEKP